MTRSRIPPWLLRQPYAHRGLHGHVGNGAIENSQSAIRAACDAGYGIELDVQPASDLSPVVFHDPTLDRLTDHKGPVREVSPAELAQINLGTSADTIVSLGQTLDMIGGEGPVLIEMKTPPTGLKPDELAAYVDQCLEQANRHLKTVAFMSFDPKLVRALRQHAPDVLRGIVSEDYSQTAYWSELSPLERIYRRNLDHWSQSQPDFIAYKVGDLPNRHVTSFRRRNSIPVLTWTVRSGATAASVGQHADQIIFEDFRP